MKLKYFTRTIAVGLFGAIALVGTQLMTTIKAVDQARESAILAWSKSNPGDAEAVELYRQCLRGPSEVPPNQPPVRPLTVTQCAEKAGSPSLASAVEAAEDSIEVPAPLRWL